MKVTFENINDFIQNYPIKTLNCGHSFPNDFDKIGNLRDSSLRFSSYLSFQTSDSNEICLGSYPHNGAETWKCKECNRITFSTTNDSGWGQIIEIKIDFNKKYIIEPANKSVIIEKKYLNLFVQKFGFGELLHSDLIDSNYSEKKTIQKSDNYIFGYRNYQRNDYEVAQFEVIANRDLLREIAEFEKENIDFYSKLFNG